jgi:DNA-binding NarL/FixJ family response regulator
VVLLDLDLGGYNGADAMADLAALPKAQVLILTAEEDTARAPRRGDQGRPRRAAQVEPRPTWCCARSRRWHAGEIWLDSKLMGQVMGRLTGRTEPVPVRPTRCQHGPRGQPDAA